MQRIMLQMRFWGNSRGIALKSVDCTVDCRCGDCGEKKQTLHAKAAPAETIMLAVRVAALDLRERPKQEPSPVRGKMATAAAMGGSRNISIHTQSGTLFCKMK